MTRITDAICVGLVKILLPETVAIGGGFSGLPFRLETEMAERHVRCLVWDPALIGERERRIIWATWPEEEAA